MEAPEPLLGGLFRALHQAAGAGRLSPHREGDPRS